jgi:hypothetical protein
MNQLEEETMSFRDAVEHLHLRAQRRCDQKHNLYWSLTDVMAVWTIERIVRATLKDVKP